jgi:hypothetical protein
MNIPLFVVPDKSGFFSGKRFPAVGVLFVEPVSLALSPHRRRVAPFFGITSRQPQDPPGG